MLRMSSSSSTTSTRPSADSVVIASPLIGRHSPALNPCSLPGGLPNSPIRGNRKEPGAHGTRMTVTTPRGKEPSHALSHCARRRPGGSRLGRRRKRGNEPRRVHEDDRRSRVPEGRTERVRPRRRPPGRGKGQGLLQFKGLKGVTGPTASHIHKGGKGVSGPVFIPLGAKFAL